MADEFAHDLPLASTVKKGTLMMLEERPCQVMEISRAAFGKHGHAKLFFYGRDIFTGKKFHGGFYPTNPIIIPVVTEQEFTLIDIQADGFLTLMDEHGTLREDIKLPAGERGKEISKQFQEKKDILCTVSKVNDEECVTAWKLSAPVQQ